MPPVGKGLLGGYEAGLSPPALGGKMVRCTQSGLGEEEKKYWPAERSKFSGRFQPKPTGNSQIVIPVR